MKSAFKITAQQVMETDPVTASTEESISQIKNRMEEKRLRTIPVVDEKNRLEGAISYRELVRFIQFDPDETRPERVLHQPPEFDTDDSLVDLAELRVNSGRKLMVALEADKLVGVVSETEFLDAFSEVEEFDNVSTSEIATRDIVMVSENDVLDNARHKMLDNNISRLPVVDNQGKLTGKVDSVAILRMMVPREKQNSGGTSSDRHGQKEINIAGGSEKQRMSEITVDQLMVLNPASSEEHMSGQEAIELMKEEETDEVFLTDEQYPEAIVTLKDFVSYLADLATQQTVLVQLSGVDMDEEKAVIMNQIRKQLQGSLGRKLKKPEELKVRVKKADKEGKNKIEADGWDMMDAVDDALNQLNEVIRREHGKMTDHY